MLLLIPGIQANGSAILLVNLQEALLQEFAADGAFGHLPIAGKARQRAAMAGVMLIRS
jgi:hypothetical protein